MIVGGRYVFFFFFLLTVASLLAASATCAGFTATAGVVMIHSDAAPRLGYNIPGFFTGAFEPGTRSCHATVS